MKLDRFERMLAAYGPDPAAWPDGARADATALLAGSTAAQALLRNMRQLDEAIAGMDRFGPVPGDATKRVLAGAFARIDGHERTPSRESHSGLPVWLRPAGFAFAALLLFAIGLEWGAAGATVQTNQNTAATMILDGPYRSFASL